MNLSYHDIRSKLITHIGELESYAEEIESDIVDVRSHFPADRPVVATLVGTPEAHLHKIVEYCIDAPISPTSAEVEAAEYHVTRNPDFSPQSLQGVVGFSESVHDHSALEKWSMIEFFTKPTTGIAPVNPVVHQSDAIIFVVDSRDPWSGRVWNHFENYVESHKNRIFFFLSRLESIDERDWSVLKKHLEEKIVQLSGEAIEMHLAVDEGSVEPLRQWLDSTAINYAKWNELKPLTTYFKQAMGDIESTLQEHLIWQANAASFSEELDKDLNALHLQLERRMEEGIVEASKSLSERATAIVSGVRKSFTTAVYLRSFVKGAQSLERFYEKLETVVSETLHKELTGCYDLINRSVVDHARNFKEDYQGLAAQLTKFQGELDKVKVPFILNKSDVKQEVHKTMLNWDVKAIFEEQLLTIDRTANMRIKIALALMIVAGVVGALGMNILGLVLLSIGAGLIPIVLFLRSRDIKNFCDFLHEWFIGFGPRMNPSANYLGEKIVDHAITFYRGCFTKVLNLVQERESEMPARFVKAHELTERNNEVIDLLLRR